MVWFGQKFKSSQPKSIKVHYSAIRSIGNGWYENPWFGILRLPENGWSYHLDLGWIYLPENNHDGIWLWSAERQGWIWTKSEIWPHLWEHNLRSWTISE